MALITWLSSWARRGTRQVEVRRRPALMLEVLEERIALTTGVEFNEGISLMALGHQDSLYIAGYHQQTVDFDPGPGQTWLEGAGDFLARYSAQGDLLWAKPPSDFPDAYLGGPNLATFTDPVTNVTNLYSSGLSLTTGQLGISKLDPDLNVIWTRPGYLGNLALDEAGNIYMSGGFNGTIDLDLATVRPDDTLTSVSDQDGFMAKYDADGNFQWVRQLSATGAFAAVWTGPHVIRDGTIYLHGGFRGTIAPFGFTDQSLLSGYTLLDGFLATYTTDGDYLSAGQFVDIGFRQLQVDDAGVYLAGNLNSPVDVNPSATAQHLVTPAGFDGSRLTVPDFAVVKLNLDGTLGWVKQFGNTSGDETTDMDLLDGHLYLTGRFSNTVDFDPSATGQFLLTSQASGVSDAYVLKLTTGGGLAWAKKLGGAAHDVGNHLAVSAAGVWTAGQFRPGQADFDPGPGTTPHMFGQGDEDAYVSKLSTGGNYQWAFGLGSPVRIIDNGDAGYTETGSGWKNYQQSGYQGDARSHAKGSGANKAKWTFSGLPAGTYEVQVTWKANNKNATNTPFKVNGLSVPAVNQRLAPADVSYQGTNWKSFGTWTVDGSGSLTVELSDAANGDVVADAVFIYFTGPTAAASAAVASSQGGGLAATDLATALPRTDNIPGGTGTSQGDALPLSKRSSAPVAGAEQEVRLGGSERKAFSAAADEIFIAIGSSSLEAVLGELTAKTIGDITD